MILPVIAQRECRELCRLSRKVVAGKRDRLVEVERVLGGDELEIVIGLRVGERVSAGVHIRFRRVIVLHMTAGERLYRGLRVQVFKVIRRIERSEFVVEH